MGCPTKVILEENLTFSICTHDPDTGVLTDADGAPTYRVYEDETAAAILTGNMAKLDDGNTTGFYTETIACTAANGFEKAKTYTVYIEATVDAETGGICYSFRVELNNLDSAVPTSPTADSINDYIQRMKYRMVNKEVYTEATGDYVVYKDDDITAFATVLAAFSRAAGITTRKKLE